MSKKFELFAGCLGNGTTVCNKAVEENGDYKKICHIAEDGSITWYVPLSDCPDEAHERIAEWSNSAKKKYEGWWNSLDTKRRLMHTLDKMSLSELVQYLEDKRRARDKLEEVKALQNEYVRQHGGVLMLREADETYNGFNRRIIDLYNKSHFETYIGSINCVTRNEDGEEEIIPFRRYNGEKVFNFGCDFIIPYDDKLLWEYIVMWNSSESTKERPSAKEIGEKIEAIGGTTFIWL